MPFPLVVSSPKQKTSEGSECSNPNQHGFCRTSCEVLGREQLAKQSLLIPGHYTVFQLAPWGPCPNCRNCDGANDGAMMSAMQAQTTSHC